MSFNIDIKRIHKQLQFRSDNLQEEMQINASRFFEQSIKLKRIEQERNQKKLNLERVQSTLFRKLKNSENKITNVEVEHRTKNMSLYIKARNELDEYNTLVNLQENIVKAFKMKNESMISVSYTQRKQLDHKLIGTEE